MSHLKTALTSLVETLAVDDEVIADPRAVRYADTGRSAALQGRKQEIAQLTAELGREPTPEEIELILGDANSTQPSTVHVDGSYGRMGADEMDSDDDTFARAKRGPTARRFRGESVVKEDVQGRPTYDVDDKDILVRTGYVMAPRFAEAGFYYFMDVLNDDDNNLGEEGLVGAIEHMASAWAQDVDDEMFDLFRPEFQPFFEKGVRKWCKDNKHTIDRLSKEAIAWNTEANLRNLVKN